jgi:hypothetical protein
MQPNGLNWRKLSKTYGGKQPLMRDSEITDTMCFGAFHTDVCKLQMGSTQVMSFSKGDEGPFYLSSAERLKRKYDKQTGKFRIRSILKMKLVEMLKEKRVHEPVGSLKQLQDKCRSLNLPINCREDVVEEGWVGKPKGSFQILFERGWIDPDNWKGVYTEKGTRDNMGILLEGTSILKLIQKQPDFATELTLLQYHGLQSGNGR